jgi:hypothetical protein
MEGRKKWKEGRKEGRFIKTNRNISTGLKESIVRLPSVNKHQHSKSAVRKISTVRAISVKKVRRVRLRPVRNVSTVRARAVRNGSTVRAISVKKTVQRDRFQQNISVQ